MFYTKYLVKDYSRIISLQSNDVKVYSLHTFLTVPHQKESHTNEINRLWPWRHYGWPQHRS